MCYAPPMRDPAIRVILLPRDTNASGSVFGGVILSHVDLAGVVEARKHAAKDFVTACMREVEFTEPVYVGDVVSFYTETLRVGTTSVTVGSRSRPRGRRTRHRRCGSRRRRSSTSRWTSRGARFP